MAKEKLSRKQLDDIAAEDGFKFEKDLSCPPIFYRALYRNGVMNRVYDFVTGKIINEYEPKMKKRIRFHQRPDSSTNY